MSDTEVPLAERELIEQIRREEYLLDVNATDQGVAGDGAGPARAVFQGADLGGVCPRASD